MILKLEKVEKLAKASKVQRLIYQPFKYIQAILFKEFIYPKKQKEKIVDCKTFFGKNIVVALPSATDIYLTGGKTHSSEIRLARFLILNLKEGDHFMDIGAHYGYFSLIAAQMTGKKGKVIAFEPTEKSFQLLEKNSSSLMNTEIYNQAVSDQPGEMKFYEFDNQHSEYNSFHVDQYKQEEWYSASKTKEVMVSVTSIDEFLRKNNFRPKMIKIDVEGAEQKVIEGGHHYFNNHNPMIVMEYLEPKRGNETHKKAKAQLENSGFVAHLINDQGNLFEIDNLDSYLEKHKLESENVVFIRKKRL